MTERQRALQILRGEKPDRVPWLGDLDYWASALVQRGEKPPNFKTSPAYYDWHRQLKVGFYLQGYEPYRAIHEDMDVLEWNVGYSRFRKIVTPCGILQERWNYLPESYTEGHSEYLLKSAEDLPAFNYYFEHTHYEANYEEAARRYELAGDNGLVLCYLPRSPLMQLIVLYAGIETVVLLYSTARDEFEATLSLMERCMHRACELSLQSPAECLMIPENLSSEIVGKRFFELYLRPYQTKWVERIREAGKFSFIHMDGTLKGLLREEASVGFNVLEALTPQPCGDLSIHELAEIADNDHVILWGGMPGSYLTDLVSEQEFERHTREVLEVMTQQPRYVLGVADQVPPDANPERVRKVATLVEKYGVYA